MTEATILRLINDAIYVTLLLSTPMIAVGLLVGLLVSIVQTTMSIQEQTLSFVPKILAMSAAAAFFGQWMLTVMVNYTQQLIEQMPRLVGILK